MYDRVKIFGERITATNALRRLIERNSRARVVPSVFKHVSEHLGLDPDDFGALAAREREARIDRFFREVDPIYAWKHCSLAGVDPDNFPGCLIVLTTRHPASWLLALHRKPYAALAEVPVTPRIAARLAGSTRSTPRPPSSSKRRSIGRPPQRSATRGSPRCGPRDSVRDGWDGRHRTVASSRDGLSRALDRFSAPGRSLPRPARRTGPCLGGEDRRRAAMPHCLAIAEVAKSSQSRRIKGRLR